MGGTVDGFVTAAEGLKLCCPGGSGSIEQAGYCGFVRIDPIRDCALLEKTAPLLLKCLQDNTA